MKIIIDPRLKYNYASWYLLGLEMVFGKDSLFFDVSPFVNLPYNNIHDLNAGMAFILQDRCEAYKVFIDFEDIAEVFEKQYNWCDVYGMVNPTVEQMSDYHKIIALGPEFGITLQNGLSTFFLCLKNYHKGHNHCSIPLNIYLRDYLYTNIRRKRIDKYEPVKSIRSNYVFHASTLWYNNFAKTDTNYWRGEFLKACKKAGITIDGGLFYIGDRPAILKEMPDYSKYKEEYRDFIYHKRISMDNYLSKTKESIMVFNTPSVCGCHGWKLAEYLCMGKAIISTPLSREMPYPMEHGRNIHFVRSVDELYDAVEKINNDSDYRVLLESGAREYYEKWISPEAVVKRIIARLGVTSDKIV